MSSADQEYITELERLTAESRHAKVTELLQRALSEAKKAPTAQEHPPVVKAAKLRVDKPSAYCVPITSYGWDQSSKFVKIYITSFADIDAVTDDKVHVSFEDRSMNLELLGVKGKNYSLAFSNLLKPIIPEKSNVKVKSDMIVINMCKQAQDNWSHLTQQEKKMKDAKDKSMPKPSDKKDPNESIMDLMRKMYNDGDDDMKRTIAKAWTESQEKRAKGEE